MKKTIVSAFLVIIMLFSMIGFVMIFFPSKAGDSGSTQNQKITYFWNSQIPDSVRDRYLNQIGLTIVSYPENDTYFQSTLQKLPELTRGYVVLELGGNFSVESANGFRKTSPENLTKDLCGLMPVKTLPDCLVAEK